MVRLSRNAGKARLGRPGRMIDVQGCSWRAGSGVDLKAARVSKVNLSEASVINVNPSPAGSGT